MKRLVAASLIVLLTAQPALAATQETRRQVATWLVVGLVVGAIAAIVAANRTISRTVRLLAVDGGDAMEGTFVSKGAASSGPATGSLGLRKLVGRWTQVDSGTDLTTFFLTTPFGPITAFGLSQARTPSGVATLEGEGINVLCVWTGSLRAGVATCADSSGRQYVGNW